MKWRGIKEEESDAESQVEEAETQAEQGSGIGEEAGGRRGRGIESRDTSRGRCTGRRGRGKGR